MCPTVVELHILQKNNGSHWRYKNSFVIKCSSVVNDPMGVNVESENVKSVRGLRGNMKNRFYHVLFSLLFLYSAL